MNLLKLLTFIFAVKSRECLPVQKVRDPDLGKTIQELVESKGFKFEEYPLKIGMYLIKLHRVLKPARCANDDPRKVVVFGEPLGGASDLWVLDLANNSWAFYLANHCFDVWLTNCRGTSYGDSYANGTKASAFDRQFYDFTYVDIGAEDMTAQIDFVLKKTGQQKVFWFGMSQGAFSGFAMLAKRREYNKKIRAFASLGGARATCFSELVYKAAGLIQLGGSLQSAVGGVVGSPRLMAPICTYAPGICGRLLAYLGGKYDNGVYINASRVPIYAEHFPHGTSLKNLLYYGQVARNCSMGEYEFDEDFLLDQELVRKDPGRYSNNLKKYGSVYPPKIPNRAITVPVRLYYSTGDILVRPKNVELLIKDLPNVSTYFIQDFRFSHGSFAVPAMYPPIFQDVLKFYEGFLT